MPVQGVILRLCVQLNTWWWQFKPVKLSQAILPLKSCASIQGARSNSWFQDGGKTVCSIQLQFLIWYYYDHLLSIKVCSFVSGIFWSQHTFSTASVNKLRIVMPLIDWPKILTAGVSTNDGDQLDKNTSLLQRIKQIKQFHCFVPRYLNSQLDPSK